MPGLYIDTDVAKDVARLLAGAGYDVVRGADLGLGHAADSVHLLEAARQGRVLVSHNVNDFQLLHEAWQRWSTAWGAPKQHPGILLPTHANPHDVFRQVDTIIASQWPLVNELYRWRDRGGWVRHQMR